MPFPAIPGLNRAELVIWRWLVIVYIGEGWSPVLSVAAVMAS
jgi:hypothetical protein